MDGWIDACVWSSDAIAGKEEERLRQFLKVKFVKGFDFVEPFFAWFRGKKFQHCPEQFFS
jgi:hypothetical protein